MWVAAGAVVDVDIGVGADGDGAVSTGLALLVAASAVEAAAAAAVAEHVRARDQGDSAIRYWAAGEPCQTSPMWWVLSCPRAAARHCTAHCRMLPGLHVVEAGAWRKRGLARAGDGAAATALEMRIPVRTVPGAVRWCSTAGKEGTRTFRDPRSGAGEAGVGAVGSAVGTDKL